MMVFLFQRGIIQVFNVGVHVSFIRINNEFFFHFFWVRKFYFIFTRKGNLRICFSRRGLSKLLVQDFAFPSLTREGNHHIYLYYGEESQTFKARFCNSSSRRRNQHTFLSTRGTSNFSRQEFVLPYSKKNIQIAFEERNIQLFKSNVWIFHHRLFFF